MNEQISRILYSVIRIQFYISKRNDIEFKNERQIQLV